ARARFAATRRPDQLRAGRPTVDVVFVAFVPFVFFWFTVDTSPAGQALQRGPQVLLERRVGLVFQHRVQHLVDGATIVAEIPQRGGQIVTPDVGWRGGGALIGHAGQRLGQPIPQLDDDALGSFLADAGNP